MNKHLLSTGIGVGPDSLNFLGGLEKRLLNYAQIGFVC